MKLEKIIKKIGETKKQESIEIYRSLNETKADFGSIYNQRDPRAYFSTLAPLGYKIPQMARPVLQAVLARLRALRGKKQVHAVDLGCSYGINATLLKRGLSLPDLYEHYMDPAIFEADPAKLAEQDKGFYDKFPPSDDLRITGVDAAENAVAYAKQAGLLDYGVAADLERAPPPPELRVLFADADAVISTGCVGYVTRVTFNRILEARGRAPLPWVASFVLRIFPYDDIAASLAAHGLVTEKLDGILFPQRRFADGDERAHTLAGLRGMGIDPSGLEEQHGFLAEFYLSRPRDESRELPLREFVSPVVLPAEAITDMRP